MQESNLRLLQQQFKNDLLKKTSNVLSEIKNDSDYSAVRRLSVYRGTIVLTIEYVAGDFSSLEELVGQKRLHELIEEFLRAEPSDTADMSDISPRFPTYLAKHHDRKIAEAARYDWAQVLTSTEFETDLQYSPLSELHDLKNAQLVLAPSLQLFDSPLAVNKDFAETPTYLALQLVDDELNIDTLTNAEFRILSALKSAVTLPEILNQLEGLNSTEAEVSQAFAKWVKNGTIIGFRKKEPR
jgi:hypothetical protein